MVLLLQLSYHDDLHHFGTTSPMPRSKTGTFFMSGIQKVGSTGKSGSPNGKHDAKPENSPSGFHHLYCFVDGKIILSYDE